MATAFENDDLKSAGKVNSIPVNDSPPYLSLTRITPDEKFQVELSPPQGV